MREPTGMTDDDSNQTDPTPDQARESAERQARRVQPDDPYTEPDNARTDEWFGQSVDRDAALADRLVQEGGGDLEAAEEQFEDRAQGAERQAERHEGS
jgi:hypothetical protein